MILALLLKKKYTAMKNLTSKDLSLEIEKVVDLSRNGRIIRNNVLTSGDACDTAATCANTVGDDCNDTFASECVCVSENQCQQTVKACGSVDCSKSAGRLCCEGQTEDCQFLSRNIECQSVYGCANTDKCTIFDDECLVQITENCESGSRDCILTDDEAICQSLIICDEP